MNPVPALLLSLLVLARPVAGNAAPAPNDPAPATELSRMTVVAGVPLRKTAEHRMLEPRFAPAAVADGHFIYIVAGSGADDRPLASIERFDVRTGRSETFASLHTARLWHHVVLVGRRLYVIGGDSLNGLPPPTRPSPILSALQTSPVDSFPATDELGELWLARERIEPGPVTPSRSSASAPLRYVSAPPPAAPGRNPLASVEIVDLDTGAVTDGPPLPRPRTNFACAAFGGHIYVFGGRAFSSAGAIVSNRVFVLDTATNQWTEAPPSPRLRSDAAAVAVSGGFIVVAGGYRHSFALDAVDVLDPRTGHWSKIAPLTRPCSAHSLVFHGHHLFLFGDYGNPGELIAYDLQTKTSETFTLQYEASRHTAAVVADDRIFVIGGRTDRHRPPTDRIQVFAPTRS